MTTKSIQIQNQSKALKIPLLIFQKHQIENKIRSHYLNNLNGKRRILLKIKERAPRIKTQGNRMKNKIRRNHYQKKLRLSKIKRKWRKWRKQINQKTKKLRNLIKQKMKVANYQRLISQTRLPVQRVVTINRPCTKSTKIQSISNSKSRSIFPRRLPSNQFLSQISHLDLL